MSESVVDKLRMNPGSAPRSLSSGRPQADPEDGLSGMITRSGAEAQATPSFFCSAVEEVVYWKVSRFSG
jgi:hypothetical protein